MSVSSKDFMPRKIPLSFIIVRPATLFDLSEIMRIERQSFREQYPRGLFMMFLDANRETFLVAEYSGQVVGYVMAYIRPDMEGHIMSIAVDPLYRGNGIGRLLMEAVIDRLIKRGARYIGLEVRVSNKGAIKLYEKLGFKKMKIIRGYYSDGEDAYYMMLDLNTWGGKS